MDNFAIQEKEKLTKGWVNASKEDVKIAQELILAKHFHYGLFFCQLAIEKILKAIFIIKKDTYPPPIHNLVSLAKKIELDLPEVELNDLEEITSFNIEARYDVLKKLLYKKATPEFTQRYLSKTLEFLDKFGKLL